MCICIITHILSIRIMTAHLIVNCNFSTVCNGLHYLGMCFLCFIFPTFKTCQRWSQKTRYSLNIYKIFPFLALALWVVGMLSCNDKGFWGKNIKTFNQFLQESKTNLIPSPLHIITKHDDKMPPTLQQKATHFDSNMLKFSGPVHYHRSTTSNKL